MSITLRSVLGFGLMAVLILAVGAFQSWSLALTILNMCLISAVMALGVNVQWGYAGLFNVGIMGFAALGGVAAVLVSVPPVPGAWSAGGFGIVSSLLALMALVGALVFLRRALPPGAVRTLLTLILLVGGLWLIRGIYLPAVSAIEGHESSKSGFLGGLGLPIILSWLVGGLFAAAAAWAIGKVALGLRSDYLAIATLGISEIIIAVIKNEDWLTRGVKNVSGLDRPVFYEVELQRSPWFIEQVERFVGSSLPAAGAARDAALRDALVTGSSLFVKLCYAGLFLAVLLLLLFLARRAQVSPWGRMMRGIRDRRDAAEAMGKDVTARHLQVFVIGSAIVGIAGAMLTTLEGQLTPGAYNPLRFTFLIWVMVIVGGSGNNLGAVLGAFVVWFFWVEAEPLGLWLVGMITSPLPVDNMLRVHLLENAQHTRLLMMGVVLLVMLRFSPKGLLPEQTR
ncbi:MAG: branched-chain amino acid ABC transporter permease [Gammaproteobacteria bacterium]|nr:MAG: branched-chain amino acid ABC transporter permease [Gammaproteobacteria bacterium]